MKRKWLLCSLICLFFCLEFKIPIVFAANIENDIIHSVDYFKVTDNGKIKISGFAFIDHMDNKGGSDGNIKTYIVAYIGDWKKTWVNDITKCTAGNKEGDFTRCLAFKLGSTSTDMYGARCTGTACSNAAWNAVNSSKNYTLDTCTGGSVSANGGSYSGSHCRYQNVGFSLNKGGKENTDFNLKKIYKKLFEKASELGHNEIKFMIVVTATNPSMAKYIDLAVSENACKGILGDADCQGSHKLNVQKGCETKTDVQDGTEVTKKICTTFKAKVKFGDFAKTAVVTAINASPKTLEGKLMKNNTSYIFANKTTDGIKNATYELLGITDRQYTHQKGKVSYNTYFYRLHTSAPSSGVVKSGTAKEYYAPTGWVQVSGNLKIKLSDMEIVTEIPTTTITKKSCDGKVCFGNGCNPLPSFCDTAEIETKNTGGEDVDECKNGVTFSSTYENTYENKERLWVVFPATDVLNTLKKYNPDIIAIAVGQSAVQAASGKISGGTFVGQSSDEFHHVRGFTANNIEYYGIPIGKIQANVIYSQKGTFTNRIGSGEKNEELTKNVNGVSYNGETYGNYRFFTHELSYELNTFWSYPRYVRDTSSENTYPAQDTSHYNIAAQKKDGTWIAVPYAFQLTGSEYLCKTDAFSDDEGFSACTQYYIDDNNNIYKAIADEGRKTSKVNQEVSIQVNYDDFNDANALNKQTKTVERTVSSSDDNVNNLNEKDIKTETWSLTLGTCMSLYGNVYFGPCENDNEILPSNNVFVPLNYSLFPGTFQFDVNATSLNYLNNSYQATCNILVSLDPTDPPPTPSNPTYNVVYRPIDVSNPFPKAVSVDDLPINWQKYVESLGESTLAAGLERVTNFSFKDYYYVADFQKGNATLDNYQYDYATKDDTDAAGNNKLISTDVFSTKNRGYHSGLGVFDKIKDSLKEGG